MRKYLNIVMIALILAVPRKSYNRSEEIRILLQIFQKREKLTICNPAGLVINDDNRDRTTRMTLSRKNNSIACDGKSYHEIRVKPVRPSRTVFTTEFGEKEYDGCFIITLRDGKFRVINITSLNSYLMGVVGAELGDLFGLETLKAQAVVSRTYFRAVRGEYGRDDIDVIDLAGKCQAFRGLRHCGPRTEQAVFETTGEILHSRDPSFVPYFHSTCGGVLLSPEEAWHDGTEGGKQAVPRFDGSREHPNCAISPFFTWEARIEKSKILSALSEKTRREIEDIKFDFTPGGLLKRVRCRTGSGTLLLRGYIFKAYLEREGISSVRSTRFTVEENGSEYYFRGKGFGHFVGMCQWGAEGMARRGTGYRAILKYYYPETNIVVDR